MVDANWSAASTRVGGRGERGGEGKHRRVKKERKKKKNLKRSKPVTRRGKKQKGTRTYPALNNLKGGWGKLLQGVMGGLWKEKTGLD